MVFGKEVSMLVSPTTCPLLNTVINVVIAKTAQWFPTYKFKSKDLPTDGPLTMVLFTYQLIPRQALWIRRISTQRWFLNLSIILMEDKTSQAVCNLSHSQIFKI